MKKSTLLFLGMLLPSILFAQQSTLRYKTNNRNASESIDAAVYNPAGMIWLKDGFHFELGNQLAFGSKKIYDGLTETTYKATGGSPFDPTAILVYKKNKFAANFAFGASGASGGSMPDGSPMLTMAGYGVSTGIAQEVNAGLLGLGLPQEAVNPFTNSLYNPGGGSLEEGSLDLGFMGNVAYKTTDWLSLSLGAKYLYRTDDFMKGNVTINTNENAINDFSNTLQGIGLPQAQIDAILSQVPVINGDVASVDANYKNNNYWMFSIGANIRPNEKLLIGQTFYFGPSYTAKMNLKSLYTIDPEILPELEELLGMKFEDGAEVKRKVKPLYNLGIAYHINEKFRVETNFNASLDSRVSDNLKNEYSFGLGAEYQIAKSINWGAGFKYSPVRKDPNYMSDIDFKNDFMWIASGFDISFTDNFKGIITAEIGVPTGEQDYYMSDNTTLLKSYKDNPNISAAIGIVYSF